MRRAALGLSLCLSLTVGCAPFVSWRTDVAHHYQASKAWKEHKAQIGASRFADSDYAHGWKQGYFDSACGSNGAPPPVPPERYWKPYFQTAEGRKRVDAWYEGYHFGAIGSEQDGAPELARIPAAPGLGMPQAPLMAPPPVGVPGEEVLPMPDALGSVSRPTEQPPVGQVPSVATVTPPPQAIGPGPTVQPVSVSRPTLAAPVTVQPPAVAQVPPAAPQSAPTAAVLPPAPNVVATAPSAAVTKVSEPNVAAVTPPAAIPATAPSAAVTAPPAATPSPQTSIAASPSASPAVAAVLPSLATTASPSVAPADSPIPLAQRTQKPEPGMAIAGPALPSVAEPTALTKMAGPPTVLEEDRAGQDGSGPAEPAVAAIRRAAPVSQLPAGTPGQSSVASSRPQAPAPPAVMEEKRVPQTVPQSALIAPAEPIAASVEPTQPVVAARQQEKAKIARPSKRRAKNAPAVAAKRQNAQVAISQAPAEADRSTANAVEETTAKSLTAPKRQPMALAVQPASKLAVAPTPATSTAQNNPPQPANEAAPKAEEKKIYVAKVQRANRVMIRGEARPAPTLAIVPPPADDLPLTEETVSDRPADDQPGIQKPTSASSLAMSRPTPAVETKAAPAARRPLQPSEPIAAQPIVAEPIVAPPKTSSAIAKAEEPVGVDRDEKPVASDPAAEPAPATSVAIAKTPAQSTRPAASPVPIATPPSTLVLKSPTAEQSAKVRSSKTSGSHLTIGKKAAPQSEKLPVMALDAGPPSRGTLRIVDSKQPALASSSGENVPAREDNGVSDAETLDGGCDVVLPGSRGVESTATRSSIRYR